MEKQLVQTYIQAAAHFYGILHIQDFIHVMQYYEDVNLTRKEAMELIAPMVKEEKHILLVGKYICHTAIFPDVQEALSFYKRNQAKPFCYPKREVFFKYENEAFVEVTVAHRQFAIFLKQHVSASEEEITKVMRRVISKIQGDSDMRTIMEEFFVLGTLKNEDLKLFGELLKQVMNDTRRYANHGFTPNELAKQMRQG